MEIDKMRYDEGEGDYCGLGRSEGRTVLER